MTSAPIQVLLVDDDDALREITTLQLESVGHVVTACAGGAEAIVTLEDGLPDVVLTDLKMPGVDGMQVLRAVRARDPDLPVVVITAFGSVATAVAAMQRGAYDYVTKPVSRDALLLKVRRAGEHRRVLRENTALRSQVEAGGARPMLVASPVMERLMEQVRRIATADLPVLLQGESGTGKELVARELHRLSDRAAGPFVAVNCAAIPRELLEAELFGHTRGAFTGASQARDGRFRAASGGTLLLDEIGDLPIELQPKLLRVLQERVVEPVGSERSVPVDVRIVAASHRDLAGLVGSGAFRQDLFYRLAVLPLRVPPLRERRDEVVALFELFLGLQGSKAGRSLRLAPEAADALRSRSWPGNVRELENLARRVALLAPGPVVLAEDLPAALTTTTPAGPPAGARVLRVALDARPWAIELPSGGLPLPELEQRIVEEAIAAHGGNKSAAARYLGIPRHVLLYRSKAGRSLRLAPEAADALRSRSWPGNVRELENLARRVALLAPGPVVLAEDLPAALTTTTPAGPPAGARVLRVALDARPWAIELPSGGLPLPELEQRIVEEAIAAHGGNKSAAARYLGIPRHVLLYRIEKYGIQLGGGPEEEA